MIRASALTTGLVLMLAGCGPGPGFDSGVEFDGGVDAGLGDAGPRSDAGSPWAQRVVRFEPGPSAGFGQDEMPQVVLGPPQGEGDFMGSLDVVSLGRAGVIELELNVFDRPGVDFLVFENGFRGFFETAVVAVSVDGTEWRSFPCDAADGGTRGCAGAHPVYANEEKGISALDPSVAGGDGFDVSEVGWSEVHFVRITDSGFNRYGPPGGGFDLDALAALP